MTDKELIFSFLDTNYYVFYCYDKDDSFMIVDKYCNFGMTYTQLERHLVNVFGNFKIIDHDENYNNKKVVNIFHIWFCNNRDIINNIWGNFLTGLDLTKESIVLNKKIYNKFRKDKRFDLRKLNSEFKDLYNQKYFQTKVFKILNNLDKTKNSIELLEEFNKFLVNETSIFKFSSRNNFFHWYRESALKDKINDVLNDLKIILGKNEWLIIKNDKPTNRLELMLSMNEHKHFDLEILKYLNHWYRSEVNKLINHRE